MKLKIGNFARANKDEMVFANDLATDGKGRIHVSHWNGIDVLDYTSSKLGRISRSRVSATALDVTDQGELLALFANEVVKFVIPSNQ